MNILHIVVNNKVATYYKRDGEIVCGNSDYQIKFSFDSAWDAYTTKTARFIWNSKFVDVVFTGDICDVPMVTNATSILVGVYAGDLQTTTPATIGCKLSVLCGNSTPNLQSDQPYRERLLSLVTEAKEIAEEANEKASESVTAASEAKEIAEEAKEIAGSGGTSGGTSSVNIVQTTGDSTTDVMSQNAVTVTIGALREEVAQALGSYITDIDTLVGEGVTNNGN